MLDTVKVSGDFYETQTKHRLLCDMLAMLGTYENCAGVKNPQSFSVVDMQGPTRPTHARTGATLGITARSSGHEGSRKAGNVSLRAIQE